MLKAEIAMVQEMIDESIAAFERKLKAPPTVEKKSDPDATAKKTTTTKAKGKK